MRPVNREAAFRATAAQYAKLQLRELDLFVVEFHLRDEAVLLQQSIRCIVGVIEATREAFTQDVVDIFARVLLFLQVVLQRVGPIQFEIQRDDSHAQREPRLLRIHACSIPLG